MRGSSARGRQGGKFVPWVPRAAFSGLAGPGRGGPCPCRAGPNVQAPHGGGRSVGGAMATQEAREVRFVQPRVRLVAYTKDPYQLAVASARTCYAADFVFAGRLD